MHRVMSAAILSLSLLIVSPVAALISTSAVFGVGLILAGIGASQCQVIQRLNQQKTSCVTPQALLRQPLAMGH
jgi:hypothetical protein